MGTAYAAAPASRYVLSRSEGINTNVNEYKGLVPNRNITPDNFDINSTIGTAVFDNLVIAAGKYVDSTYGAQAYNETRLDNVLITLNQQSNIILTPIQGRDGEVIEYVSKMSFRINVKGGIFGTNLNSRPISEITNFKMMVQSNNPLVVVPSKTLSGGFLSEWDISQFVIINKNIPQMMGGYNYQLFEFDAIQDLPVVLAQQQAIN